MSTKYTVTLRRIIICNHDMFDHMDGIMWTLRKNETQWKEQLYFAATLMQETLCK